MEPSGKRMKTRHQEPLKPSDPEDPKAQQESEEHKNQTVIIQFRDSEDNDVGFEISVDTTTSKADLNRLIREVKDPEEGEEHQLYQFYLDDKEVKGSIQEILDRIQNSKLKDAQAKKS